MHVQCLTAKDCRAVSSNSVLNSQPPERLVALAGYLAVWEDIMNRICILLLSSLILAACAATGHSYTSMPISKGEAQLVVYRSPNGGPAPIEVNGLRQCKLPRDGYFILNVPAGKTTTLTTHLLGDPDISTYRIQPKAGERHYVRVEINSASVIAGTLAGVIGTMAAPREGSFVFREGSESEASTKRSVADCS